MAEVDFEKFMIEIGQWAIKDGQVITVWNYIPRETIMSKYKDWCKRNDNKTK